MKTSAKYRRSHTGPPVRNDSPHGRENTWGVPLQYRDLNKILGLDDLHVDHLNTQAAMIIGDDSVTAIIARLKDDGRLLPHRLYSVDLRLPPGVTPGLADLNQAMETCWYGMGHPQHPPYQNFFLCLPGWCCRGRQVEGELKLVQEVQTIFDRIPRITREHIIELEDRCAKSAEDRQHETIGLRPYYYVLDTGRKVEDPERARSTTLELKGYANLAERGFIAEVLSALQKLDIRVDGIITPPNASQPLVGDKARRKGWLILELDRQSTNCSYYECEELRGQYRINAGTEVILGRASDQLQCGLTTLTSVLRRTPEAQLRHEGHASYRLWPPSHRSECLRVLVFAARKPALDIVQEAVDHFRDRDLVLNEQVEQVLVVADDYLSSRAVQEVLQEKYAHRCVRPEHDWPETAQTLGIHGAWRALGVIAHAREPGHRRHYALERYTLPIETRVLASAGRWSRTTARLARQKMIGVPELVHTRLTGGMDWVVKALRRV